MPGEPLPKHREPSKRVRLLLVLVGILLGQVILYGPSLSGRKVLLPLDLLAGNQFYLPSTPETSKIQPKDGSLSDMIFLFEPARRFAASEFRAGRLPTWNPFYYAGAPFNLPLLSPYTAVQCSSGSPVVLAWSQLLLALIAGSGAYRFCRRALGLSFWPSALAAWCYPLTGFFILWQGFPMTQPVAWLPWVLLAVDRTVSGSHPLAPLSLAAVTCLVLNGQLDVAGQVLLNSGLYAVWCLAEVACARNPNSAESAVSLPALRSYLTCLVRIPFSCRAAIMRVAAGWTLGFLLAAPYILPVLAYTQTGMRMAHRSGGKEERPPVGLSALPQMVLPDMYGTRQVPSARYAGGPVQQESSAAAYAGVIATLLAAPLAFCSRRHRSRNLLWVLLTILALAWCLNVPGIVAMLRLPGLRLMSHDRLVFIGCFSILALAATGIEALLGRSVQWKTWMWAPLLILATLCGWCVYRTIHLPEPIASIAAAVSAGKRVSWIEDADGVKRLFTWFVQYYTVAAVICGVGALGWVFLHSRRFNPIQTAAVLGPALFLELLWFGYGRNVQCASELYFPPVPVLQALAKAPPGRVMGCGCLPANLSVLCGLRDIRGYDGVDPAQLVELVSSAGDPLSIRPPYALTMELAPKAAITPAGNIQLSPILDMLGVRYVLFRGSPIPKTRPLLEGLDYWVLVNPRALPRAFVPNRVEQVSEPKTRLTKLESPGFDPTAVAYIEQPVRLPAACRGNAQILSEIPTELRLTARMDTAGLVVLTDLWDPGWHAYLDGARSPVLRVNNAVRGVVVPAGSHKLTFRYEPATFTCGLGLAAAAALLLLFWAWRVLRQHHSAPKPVLMH